MKLINILALFYVCNQIRTVDGSKQINPFDFNVQHIRRSFILFILWMNLDL